MVRSCRQFAGGVGAEEKHHANSQFVAPVSHRSDHRSHRHPVRVAAPALAQVEPAATDETNAQTLLLPAQQDTTLVQLRPAENFGAQPTLVVGRQMVGIDQISSFDTLVQWDLSASPRGHDHQRCRNWPVSDRRPEYGRFRAGLSSIDTVGRAAGHLCHPTRDRLYDRTWSPALNTDQYVFYQGDPLNNTTAANLVQGWVNVPLENYGVMLGYGGTGQLGRGLSPAGKRQTSTRRCCASSTHCRRSASALTKLTPASPQWAPGCTIRRPAKCSLPDR